jgi:hypothetical protein
MPQPLEFKVTVTAPGPAVSLWDAFVTTVGRIVIPAAGQTTLGDPDSDISNSVRHVAFFEECSGDPLPDERMLTPQFSAAGWPDIRPEVRHTYAEVKSGDVASAFAATIPLNPKLLGVVAPVFRHQPRPEEVRLVPLAGAELEVGADSAAASVTIERWLLTPAHETCGLAAADISSLIEDVFNSMRDLKRSAPGNGAVLSIVIPTTNLLPDLEQKLKRFQAEAAG